MSDDVTNQPATTPWDDQWTTVEIELSTCGGEVCVNGEDSNLCIINNNGNNCSCEVEDVVFFKGDLCEYVLFNEDLLNVSTTARTGVFTWPNPPMIRSDDYKFVYKSNGEQPDADTGSQFLTDDEIVMQEFNMIDDVTARIIELDSGQINFTVCVMNNTEAYRVSDERDFSALSLDRDNCLSLVTQESVLWEYTLAAYIIGGMMIAAVTGLIVLKLCLDRYQNIKKYLKIGTSEDDSSSVACSNHSSDQHSNTVYEENYDNISQLSSLSAYSAPLSEYGGSLRGDKMMKGYSNDKGFEPEADY